VIRVADSHADLERCVEICNAIEPENPVHVEQFSLERGTTLMHEGAGYAFVLRSSVAGSAYAMVRVHPEARGRGTGSALLAAARERARSLGLGSLWGRVRDEESLAFVMSRGFVEQTREVNVVRDVRADDGEIAPGIAEMREEHLPGSTRSAPSASRRFTFRPWAR
jgi:GNAT superfamily N-acetyltransferase